MRKRRERGTSGCIGARMLALATALPLLLPLQAMAAPALPPGFVYLSEIAPGILQNIRYAGSDNFLGRPADGYAAAECILTREAAAALSRVQSRLEKRGLSLKVFDCYRPHRASLDFLRWAQAGGPKNDRHHPALGREKLFARGYIAARSGHSSGSSVDLTVVRRTGADAAVTGKTGACTEPPGDGELDFGTGFDCFDALSATASPGVSAAAKDNRRLLVDAMAREGFRNYAREWWHFSLAKAPFAGRYFDFPIPSR